MVIQIQMRFYSLVSNWSHASHIKPHKNPCHQTKCDVIDDVKLFPTVYRRIYFRQVLTLSNQTSLYKSKCIRIVIRCNQLTSKKHTNLHKKQIINPFTVCGIELSILFAFRVFGWSCQIWLSERKEFLDDDFIHS